MSKEAFNFEEFQDQVKNKPATIKKNFKNDALANIIIDAGQSKKSFSTLKAYSKDDLFKIVLNGEQDSKPAAKVGSSNNKDMIDTFIDGIEEIKIEIHGSKLNKFVKKTATSVSRNLLDKFTMDNDDLTDKLGWVGNIISYGMLILDVFVGIDKIPAKVKEFKEKKKLQGKELENKGK